MLKAFLSKAGMQSSIQTLLEHSCVAEKVSILFHRNQDSVLNVTMLFLDTDVTFMTRMANHNSLKIR